MGDNGLLNKLEQISIKYDEIAKQMVDPDVISDMKRYVRLNQEYKDLTIIVNTYKDYKDVIDNIYNTKEIIQSEEDQEFKEMAKLELEDFLEKFWTLY